MEIIKACLKIHFCNLHAPLCGRIWGHTLEADIYVKDIRDRNKFSNAF